MRLTTHRGCNDVTSARLRAAAGLLGAVLVSSLAAPAGASGTPTQPAASQSTVHAAGTNGKVAGFGVPTGAHHDEALESEAGRIAATGANTVMLDATWQVDAQSAHEIHPGEMTISDEDLLLAAQRVRSAGMSPMLTVKVVCQGCRQRWRGLLRPSDREAFFESYRKMTNHYAQLAQQMGVIVYFIGSEMNSLQGESNRWRQVVLEARTHYGGKIGYEINWDAMKGVSWWDDVDVAGVSAYFPLSDEMQPNLADLLAAWQSSDVEASGSTMTKGRNWVAELQSLARSSGKPILFGEVGYQSAQQAAQYPYQQGKTKGYDAQLQADAYQAVLTTFEQQSWWLGVIWWEWKVTGGGTDDLDYSPRTKLAETFLQRWYAGQRPSARTVSLVGVTRPSAKASNVKPRLPNAPAAGTTGSRPRGGRLTPSGTTGPGTSASTAPSASASGVATPGLPGSPSGLPSLPGAVTSGLPTPELPDALEQVPTGTIEASLQRAAAREEHRRATLGAGVLTALVLVGHAAVWAPRVRRRFLLPRPTASA